MSVDLMSVPTGTSNSDDLNDQRIGNDVELRELVYQTLDRDGIITRLKAQLRAAVFSTFEKTAKQVNIKTNAPSYDGMTGRVCRALVLNWLEHSKLLYTEDIFKVETTGSNHPPPLSYDELLEQLHITSDINENQPILHLLIDRNKTPSVSTINSLPEHIKQSIDDNFLTEKINDLNRVHEHFRSLFSSAFDTNVLDAFMNKNLSSSSPSISKSQYENICLKWIQSCANVLTPNPTPVPTSTKQVSSLAPVTRSIISKEIPHSNLQSTSPFARPKAPIEPSSSSSSSSKSDSSSEIEPKRVFDFPLPTTTTNSNKPADKKTIINKSNLLIDLDDEDDSDEKNNEDDEEETSTSTGLFSKRNATPTALNRLKNIEHIIQGDTTPRTRTIINKSSNNETKDLPVEYDDESMSHSVSHSIISSVDDITLDKDPMSSTGNIDYIENV